MSHSPIDEVGREVGATEPVRTAPTGDLDRPEGAFSLLDWVRLPEDVEQHLVGVWPTRRFGRNPYLCDEHFDMVWGDLDLAQRRDHLRRRIAAGNLTPAVREAALATGDLRLAELAVTPHTGATGTVPPSHGQVARAVELGVIAACHYVLDDPRGFPPEVVDEAVTKVDADRRRRWCCEAPEATPDHLTNDIGEGASLREIYRLVERFGTRFNPWSVRNTVAMEAIARSPWVRFHHYYEWCSGLDSAWMRPILRLNPLAHGLHHAKSGERWVAKLIERTRPEELFDGAMAVVRHLSYGQFDFTDGIAGLMWARWLALNAGPFPEHQVDELERQLMSGTARMVLVEEDRMAALRRVGRPDPQPIVIPLERHGIRPAPVLGESPITPHQLLDLRIEGAAAGFPYALSRLMRDTLESPEAWSAALESGSREHQRTVAELLIDG